MTLFAFDGPAPITPGEVPVPADTEFAFTDALPWTDALSADAPGTSAAPSPMSSRRQKTAQPEAETRPQPAAVLTSWLGMLSNSSLVLLVPIDPTPSAETAPPPIAQGEGRPSAALPAANSLGTGEPYQFETHATVELEPVFQLGPASPVSLPNAAAAIEESESQPAASSPRDEERRPQPGQGEAAEPPDSPSHPLPALALPTVFSPQPTPPPTDWMPAPINATGPDRPPQTGMESVPKLNAAPLTVETRQESRRPQAPAAPSENSEFAGQKLPQGLSLPVSAHQEVFRLAVRSNSWNEGQPACPPDDPEPALATRPSPPAASSAEAIKRDDLPLLRDTPGRATGPEEDRNGAALPLPNVSAIWLPSPDRTEGPGPLTMAAETPTVETPDTVRLPEPAAQPDEPRAAPTLTDLTLRQADGERVSLHLQQSSRGLEVRVSAADEGARQELRAGLDELLQRVEKEGLGTLWPVAANNDGGDEREASGQHRQPPEPEPETRRGRRARGSAEASSAFTALLGLGNTGREDSR